MNSTGETHRIRYRCAAVSSLLFLLCSPLSNAQPMVPPASPAPPEELVTLTPFEVRDTAVQGYISSESTVGTRYATKIKEVPFPVNVITSEFMADIVADTLDDVLAYSSSFTSNDGGFILRGISGSESYKNGIHEGGNSAGVFATTAVERVEVIKGSGASIYGATSPTGLINVVTKRAHHKPAQSLRAEIGNLDYHRFQIDVNQPLLKDRLAVRVAASTLNNETANTNYFRKTEDVFYGTLGWAISPRTVLNLNAEWIERKNWGASRRLPFSTNLFTLNGQSVRQFDGHFGLGAYEADRFYKFNASGPNQTSTLESRQFDANISHSFNESLTLRVNAGHWQRFTPSLNTTQGYNGSNTATSYDASVDRLLGNAFEIRNIRRREFRTVGQADLLARFQTGTVKHHLLLNAETNNYDEAIINQATTRPDARAVTPDSVFKGTVIVSPTFPYGAPLSDRTVWDNLRQNTKTEREATGLMINERAALFEDRLILILGMRHDEVKTQNIDMRAAVPAWSEDPVVKADTLQSGAVWAFTPALSVYASYSESFTPNDPDLFDGNFRLLPNLEGTGKEFGFKGEFFDKRLGFTLGYYHIIKSNVPRSALDITGTPLTIGDTGIRYYTVAEITSEGYELDWNWRATDWLELLGGAGWNEALFSNVPNPTEQWLLDLPPDNSAEWTAALNAVVKVPTGRFKGLNGRLGIRYEGERTLANSPAQVSTIGNSGIKGQPLIVGGQSFDRYFFSTDPLWLVDAGASYNWKSGDDRFGHSVRLTVKNLFDKRYVRSRRAGDPLSVIFNYEIRH